MSIDTAYLNKLIAEGESQEAITYILAQKNEIATPLYREALSISADLSEYLRAKRTGTLSEEVLRLQRNQINQSLLMLSDELAKPVTAGKGGGEITSSRAKAEDQALTEIEKAQSEVERWVETTAFVVAQFIRRPLKYKFINLLVLLLALPFLVSRAASTMGVEIEWLASLYQNKYFWITLGTLFVVAVSLAVRDILKKPSKRHGFDYSDSSPIKGLRSFDFEDAAIFKQLQRHDEINTCLQGILQKEYRFGILTGESGCGKTSFLKAGLAPALMEKEATCVVAKLRNEDPLLSIEEALKEQLKVHGSPSKSQSLNALLDHYLKAAKLNKLILILDQFEQFFTQQKTIESRRSFIDQLQDCYQEQPKVRLLVSLRKDFQGYLFEVQDILGYSLTTRQNYFDLTRFSPLQATEIFRVMAEAEGLEVDTSFLFEMCRDELASKEDGLISAVDIQILAFIIEGQQLEEKAFTRSAFQRMGGVEGLLQRFLEEQFNAPNRYNQDKAALKVLLAFIDLENNVRVGELSLEELLPRIDQRLNSADLQSILDWLEADLRLISRTEAKGQQVRYELAHERLIVPLRNLAGKTLSDMDQANIILERRTNEWVANDRKGRFLLSWSEYRNIQRHRKLLVWGKKEEQKRALLQSSRRKLQGGVGVALLLAVLTFLSWGWYQNNEVINTLYAKADDHILALKYDSAMVQLWQASRRPMAGKEAAKRMMEVAFYYNEIGRVERAQGVLDTMAKVSSEIKWDKSEEALPTNVEQQQERIRTVLQATDPLYYDSVLVIRYFPEMIAVKGGTFLLGCPSNNCDTSSADVVQVKLSDYKIARTETTVWQYQLFAEATGRQQEKEIDWGDWIGTTPAINVSWFDAVAYANWLSQRMQVQQVYQLDSIPVDPNDLYRDSSLIWPAIADWEANGYRLPTEAEWEYAARGGSRLDTFAYSGSDTVGLVAWYSGNVELEEPFGRTHSVSTRQANSLGLYDMSGNVYEWCWDWYQGGFDPKEVLNPIGPEQGRYRVLRGGSWDDYSNDCEVSNRNYLNPDFRNDLIGFRLTQGL